MNARPQSAHYSSSSEAVGLIFTLGKRTRSAVASGTTGANVCFVGDWQILTDVEDDSRMTFPKDSELPNIFNNSITIITTGYKLLNK